MADLFKLAIPPDTNAYTVKPGTTVVQTQLDGGAPRTRADFDGAAEIVTVQWTVGKDGFEYLRAFYRTATGKGALPFTADLQIEAGAADTYTCYFQQDSFQLASVSGLTYVITATLLVLPNPDDAIADQQALAKFQTL